MWALASAPAAPSPALTCPQSVLLFHMSVTAVTSVLFGDELVLNEDTNCDDVIIRYGSCLGLASQAIDRIHVYVTWLRSKGYRIHNEDELERVKAVLKSGFPNSDLR